MEKQDLNIWILFKEEYSVALFKQEKLKKLRIFMIIILILQIVVLLPLFITKPKFILAYIPTVIIVYFIMTFLICILNEIPKKAVLGGIKKILEESEKLLKEDLEESTILGENSIEQIKNNINIENVPKKLVLNTLLYRLKQKNIQLLITFPIVATMTFKSLQLLPRYLFDFVNLFNFKWFNDIKSAFDAAYNNSSIGSLVDLFPLFFIAYLLTIYYFEVERINLVINKIEYIISSIDLINEEENIN
ncbi:hypothetical protein [Brassicibacter mesophilus]|uniref:hypothetical protein n=1 Tax=Brassicibacter mesophilus TaxID=745119 RepID=UPI003D1FDE8A